MSTLSHLLEYKLVSIIRGADPGAVGEIANALWEGGIRCMEITLNSEGALKVIKQLSGTMDGRMMIGAGTVLDAASARDAIDAGARFIISPIFDEATIHATRELGAVSIPGAFSPTEIFRAFAAGGNIIKVFPGSSGPAFIREMRGPLPQIPLMPTGGINLQNLDEFRKAGAVAYGIGKGLVDTSQQFSDAYLEQIRDNAKAFVQAVGSRE